MSSTNRNARKGSEGRVFTIVRGGERPSEDGDNAWVFESLVGFLTGPIWNSTMMTFLEHKSIVFDPNEDNQDEYRKIHEEYRNLVDLMLNSFTEDLGISAEQFEKACSQANGDIVTSQLQKTLFDQIWAAEDYTVFVNMMIQKNTELQLQAVEFLKKRGVSFDADAPPPLVTDQELKEVLRRSMEEHDKEQAVEREVKSAVPISEEDDRQNMELDNESERQLLDKAVKLSLESNEEQPSGEVHDSKPANEQFEKVHKNQVQTTKTAIGNLENRRGSTVISEEEVAKRRAYLRQQRDKLLTMKQKNRIRQLNEQPESEPARPRSSSMARSVIESGDGNASGTNQIDPGILAARRALATRLKAEVLERK